VAVNTIFGTAINPSSLIKMLGILCTSYFCPDKSGRQVSLYSVSSNLGAIFEPDRSSVPRPRIPETGR
jgi:hypothetical protein